MQRSPKRAWGLAADDIGSADPHFVRRQLPPPAQAMTFRVAFVLSTTVV